MKKQPALLIVFAAILWSFDALLRRHLYSIPPATLVMLEHALGVFIVLPWLPKVIGEYKKMSRFDWLVILIITFFASVLGTIFYTAALAKVNFINYSVVVLLQQTQPIFAIALAVWLLKEKSPRHYLFLASIGLVSAYFLAFPQFKPRLLGSSGELTAASLALAAAFFWGSGTVLGKIILKTLSFKAVAVLRFTLAIPLAYLVSLATHQTYPLSRVTPVQWLYLIGIALSSGMVAFLIYYQGLKQTPAKIATFAEMTWPVSAAFIGLVFLKESLTAIQLLSAFILLADILILSLSAHSSYEQSKR